MDIQEIQNALIQIVTFMNVEEVSALAFRSKVSSAHRSLILLQGLMSTIAFKFTKHLIRLAFPQVLNIYHNTKCLYLILFILTFQIIL